MTHLSLLLLAWMGCCVTGKWERPSLFGLGASQFSSKLLRHETTNAPSARTRPIPHVYTEGPPSSMVEAGFRIDGVSNSTESNHSHMPLNCSQIKHVPKNVKAVFINLEKRTDRRKAFEDSMPKYLEPFMRCSGWSLERLPAAAVEPRRPPAARTVLDGPGWTALGEIDQVFFSRARGASTGEMAEPGSLVEAEGEAYKVRAGHLAAARSHIAALRHAAGLVGDISKTRPPANPVLIFEDDFQFIGDPPVVQSRLERTFAALDSWDVLMFGDNSFEAEEPPVTLLAQVQKTKGAYCSEAYMVRPEYLVQKLLPEVEMQFERMVNGAPYIHRTVEGWGPAYDTLWYGAQKAEDSKWYVFRPKLGQQRNVMGDSDVCRPCSADVDSSSRGPSTPCDFA